MTRVVLPFHLTDADLLAIELRKFGYSDPDEIMELDDVAWCLAASNAGLSGPPTTAVRCAALMAFGPPSSIPPRPPERTSAAPRSSEAVSGSVGQPSLGGRAVPGSTGPNSKRKERG